MCLHESASIGLALLVVRDTPRNSKMLRTSAVFLNLGTNTALVTLCTGAIPDDSHQNSLPHAIVRQSASTQYPYLAFFGRLEGRSPLASVHPRIPLSLSLAEPLVLVCMLDTVIRMLLKRV